MVKNVQKKDRVDAGPPWGTSTFEDFNRKFFALAEHKHSVGLPWEYFDRLIVLPKVNVTQHDSINAEIELNDRGTCEHYNGYMVSIINRTSGMVDKCWFKFQQYLPPLRRGHDGFEWTPEIIAYCSHDWYIGAPPMADVNAMAERIMTYIGCYR